MKMQLYPTLGGCDLSELQRAGQFEVAITTLRCDPCRTSAQDTCSLRIATALIESEFGCLY